MTLIYIETNTQSSSTVVSVYITEISHRFQCPLSLNLRVPVGLLLMLGRRWEWAHPLVRTILLHASILIHPFLKVHVGNIQVGEHGPSLSVRDTSCFEVVGHPAFPAAVVAVGLAVVHLVHDEACGTVDPLLIDYNPVSDG